MTASGLMERTATVADRLGGVWCPVLTPLDGDLRPDPARFVAHARWLLEEGCHGLVVFGTTGEANSFSVEERSDLLETALGAGLPRERILVGTGCCALTDSVRLTRHALALGVAGVLMLPPFYYKDCPDEALFASFDEVIQRVGTDRFQLYLYHFPRLSGVPITPGLIERLLRRYPDTVKGVKDSSGDWSNTEMLIERFPELAIFPGAETLLLPGLEAGGKRLHQRVLQRQPPRDPQALRRFRGRRAAPRGAAGGAHGGAQGAAAAAADPGHEAPARRPAGRSGVAPGAPAVPAAARRSRHGARERARSARLADR